jgi:hypothetical protein
MVTRMPVEPFSLPRLEWQLVGEVSLCPRGRPLFPALPKGPGLYKLEIGKRAYVGSAENLKRRLLEYRNPTDNIDEHYRRHLIMEAGGATLCVIEQGLPGDKAARNALEQRAIAEAKEDGLTLINRGAKRSKDFYLFRIRRLEDQLSLARKAYDAAE